MKYILTALLFFFVSQVIAQVIFSPFEADKKMILRHDSVLGVYGYDHFYYWQSEPPVLIKYTDSAQYEKYLLAFGAKHIKDLLVSNFIKYCRQGRFELTAKGLADQCILTVSEFADCKQHPGCHYITLYPYAPSEARYAEFLSGRERDAEKIREAILSHSVELNKQKNK